MVSEEVRTAQAMRWLQDAVLGHAAEAAERGAGMSNERINIRARTETQTREIEEWDILYTCDICGRQETRYAPRSTWMPLGWKHLGLQFTVSNSEDLGEDRTGWYLCSEPCVVKQLNALYVIATSKPKEQG